MPGPSLGINLGQVVDWSTAYPFVDLFKMSRPWFTTSTSGWEDTKEAGLLDLDARGWIRGFTRDDSTAPFRGVSTVINSGGDYLRDGLYVLDWKGSGTLEIEGARVVSSGPGGHRMVLDPGTGPIRITLTSTDPKDTGDYLRDIRFYHEDDRALLDAGVVFNPAFTDRIGDFRVLRFMDWMNTNGTDVRYWSDATPFDAAQESTGDGRASGVGLDVMVALANETRADPWFNIPHGASTGYITKFATYVRDHLDPGLVARFEYSNEVWNDSFKQGQWADQQAYNAWGITNGGVQWYGVKAAEMAGIVAKVFGDETGTRALNVFATQAVNLGLEREALNAPAYVARGGTAPKEAPFHIYAIQPYFGYSLGQPDMADQVATWMTMGAAGLKAAIHWLANGPARDGLAHIGEIMAYHAQRAEGLHWQLEGYEGGQHIVDRLPGGTNTARVAFFNALLARPEMATLYEQYFQTWKAAGGGLLAHYTDFGPPDAYGSFGLWDSPTSPDTPRGLAVEDFRDHEAAWWLDSRPASAFVGIRTQVDYADTGTLTGGSGPDRLFGLDGADRLAGGDGADALYGNGGNDSLWGNRGADLLTGGGRDRMAGGRGDDTYVVDVGDTVVEKAGEGAADTVRSAGDWTLGANLEGLVLTGAASASGTGNGLANRIFGNDAANRLSGLGGRDELWGGAGADRLWGGAGADRLGGGKGADRLMGQLGADTLTGGAGDDVFVFASPATSDDRITDFATTAGNHDHLEILAAGFGAGLTAGGHVAGWQFRVADDPFALGGTARGVRFIFEGDATRLWFDPDGTGSQRPVLIADLQPGATLTAADIWLV